MRGCPAGGECTGKSGGWACHLVRAALGRGRGRPCGVSRYALSHHNVAAWWCVCVFGVYLGCCVSACGCCWPGRREATCALSCTG